MEKQKQQLAMSIYKKIKKIKNKAKYIEILEFLIKEKIDYSVKNNGVFVNLGILNEQELQELNDIINFYCIY